MMMEIPVTRLEGHDGPADDVHTLSDLILLYNEGRG